ncbi:hypothetical protein [Ilumatobacter sp.]|uniref:hypothetical protein n=1 Tax=Ilumatobacter sp. TaxID=1967498 RepID=UPI003B51EF8D
MDEPPRDGPSEIADDGFVEVVDSDTVWRFERGFLTSRWRCLFGDGCKGILSRPAEELGQGCCSLGAHFGDGPSGQEEARRISAYVALLTPARWQFHGVGTAEHVPPSGPDPSERAGVDDDAEAMGEVASESTSPTDPRRADDVGVPASAAEAATGADASPDAAVAVAVAGFYGDAERSCTRVVDGACVFLNRPGFEGGAGCALHIAALEAGDSPTEWKPSVCWQLPLRVDWSLQHDEEPDGPETATVRRWSRADWGEHGTTMAWCCTERSDGGEAYSGDEMVVDSLVDELTELAGETVYVELRRRLPPR